LFENELSGPIPEEIGNLKLLTVSSVGRTVGGGSRLEWFHKDGKLLF